MSEDTTLLPRTRATRPGWLPFSMVVATLAAITAVPVALEVLAPERADGTVGVFERVALNVDAEGAFGIGGFIAPEGWLRESDEAVDGGGEAKPSSSASFVSAAQDVRLEASLHFGADDADALLRSSSPAGTAILPITSAPHGEGREIRMLEYDLDVGGGFTQSFAMCTDRAPYVCLRFDVEMLDDAGRPGTIRPDISAVLDSAEVY
ncbi:MULTISPECIES: hypothetical protein [unclassified Leucobacter]|uniref:hypothetical protein n=1 Tax=unclassified Leucobacter TaxID=2621730 RepID=UPI00301B0588